MRNPVFNSLNLFAALDDDDGKNTDGITFSSQTGPAWAGSERDYTYDEVCSATTCQHCRQLMLCNWIPMKDDAYKLSRHL